ncbi:hypothetical protein FQA39_LY09960 [Lamprigera yunnana]|nr:hypothetical protein FQA39_LY09960 [Lamprigera yunnana]
MNDKLNKYNAIYNKLDNKIDSSNKMLIEQVNKHVSDGIDSIKTVIAKIEQKIEYNEKIVENAAERIDSIEADVRELINKECNDEIVLNEIKERMQRERNIIFFNIKENASEEEDTKTINNLLSNTHIDLSGLQILGYLFTDFILPFLKVSVSVIIIMPLNTNDTFDSYKELQDAVDLYEKENRVQFWKRDAKTITAAKHHALNLYKTVQDKELDLKYYYIKYACIHGGQPFRPKINNHLLKLQKSRWHPKRLIKSLKKAQAICMELATLCSEVSTREYEERMEILSKIHTHWQKHEQVVVGTPIETYEIPNNYDEPDQQLANSENIIDAPVAHSQNHEQVVVGTPIETYEIPNNYDEPDQQLANSENIMNAPVETNEVQGNKDTQTQAQQLENEKQEQDSLENIYLPAPIKCRGRPRGKNTTAIGLPAKKKKRTK